MRKLTKLQKNTLCGFYGTQDIRHIVNYLAERECMRIARIHELRLKSYKIKGESKDEPA